MIPGLHKYLCVAEPAFVNAKDSGEELLGADGLGIRRLLVEAERLIGDDGYATKLMIGVGKVFLYDGRDCFLLGEVKKVGDRFQWIVDLVSDGAGKSADRSKLFAPQQGSFCELAIRNVLTIDSDASHAAVGVAVRDM
jgi:hypothetical protein